MMFSSIRIYLMSLQDDCFEHAGLITLKTPLGFAIGDLFSRILPLLDGAPPRSVTVYIFGGCAVHLLTQYRGSEDVDAEIEASRLVRERDFLAVYNMPQSYEDNGESLRLYLDKKFNTCLGPLHEDYRERAIPIGGYVNESAVSVTKCNTQGKVLHDYSLLPSDHQRARDPDDHAPARFLVARHRHAAGATSQHAES